MKYDGFVVDAVSAWCSVASQKSEDPGVSVLLLEAGGEGFNQNSGWALLAF